MAHQLAVTEEVRVRRVMMIGGEPPDPGGDDEKPSAGENGASLTHVLQTLQSELGGLHSRQNAIQQRIAVVKQTIEGLSAVFGASVTIDDFAQLLVPGLKRDRSPRGLTSYCRQILRSEKNLLTLPQILSRIHDKRPELLARHKDPKNSLRTILHRLVTYGDAIEERIGPGLPGWRWVSGNGPIHVPCSEKATAEHPEPMPHEPGDSH